MVGNEVVQASIFIPIGKNASKRIVVSKDNTPAASTSMSMSEL
jgi:hypothetical protein